MGDPKRRAPAGRAPAAPARGRPHRAAAPGGDAGESEPSSSPVPTPPSPRQAGAMLWLLLLLSPSLPPSTSPRARRGALPVADAAGWGRNSTFTPEPWQRGAQGVTGSTTSQGVASFPSGFQGSLQTLLLRHGSEFLPELPQMPLLWAG